MTNSNNKFFDEFSRIMNNTAGAFRSMGNEAGSKFKSQFERWANDMDLVRGQDFEVVRDMVKKARSENNKLKKQIAELEARLSALDGGSAKSSVKTGAKTGTDTGVNAGGNTGGGAGGNTGGRAGAKTAAATKTASPKTSDTKSETN